MKNVVNKIKGIVFLVSFVIVSVVSCSKIEKYLKNRKAIVKERENRQTDTVYVNKPYPVYIIKKETIVKPVKVVVYRTDTIYRKQLEKGFIITKVDFKTIGIFSNRPKYLSVDRIDTMGRITSSQYDIKGAKELKITSNGDVSEKKKNYIPAKIIAVAISATATFIFGKAVFLKEFR